MDLFEDTSSEKYRHECELRYIANMNLQGRRKYLGLVLEKRGVKSLNKLKEGLEQLWKNKKYNKA
jgi:hypothetical protein